MPIKYSCFISYPHGQDIIRDFIEQLTVELQKRIDFYLNYPPYYDQQRLKPGFLYNEALGTAICESVCMIVVYIPKYERSSYCLREFAAMEQVERQRRTRLGQQNMRQGMIIPIVLRALENDDGVAQLPTWLTAHRHCCNFSKYATGAGADQILGNPEYVQEIERIARGIYEVFLALDELENDPCAECSDFSIPDEQTVQQRYRPGHSPGSALPLPLREMGI